MLKCNRIFWSFNAGVELKGSMSCKMHAFAQLKHKHNGSCVTVLKLFKYKQTHVTASKIETGRITSKSPFHLQFHISPK